MSREGIASDFRVVPRQIQKLDNEKEFDDKVTTTVQSRIIFRDNRYNLSSHPKSTRKSCGFLFLNFEFLHQTARFKITTSQSFSEFGKLDSSKRGIKSCDTQSFFFLFWLFDRGFRDWAHHPSEFSCSNEEIEFFASGFQCDSCFPKVQVRIRGFRCAFRS
jgi:hypothetical protein